MTAPYKTEQEAFWAGDFGDAYARRNQGVNWIASNTALFSKILARTNGVRSVIELGSNIGLNLHALHKLLPQADLAAIEINHHAAEQVRAWGGAEVHEASVLQFIPKRTWDLSFIKGVLIHVKPEELEKVYELLYASSSKYIIIAEYYNTTPIEVAYRGHMDRLFKRDFAGEILDRYSDLSLVDYGFVYHRDPNFPQDDITWFLMEKCGSSGN
jgi:pseudaminic acid biosynthesis-associated methylase